MHLNPSSALSASSRSNSRLPCVVRHPVRPTLRALTAALPVRSQHKNIASLEKQLVDLHKENERLRRRIEDDSATNKPPIAARSETSPADEPLPSSDASPTEQQSQEAVPRTAVSPAQPAQAAAPQAEVLQQQLQEAREMLKQQQKRCAAEKLQRCVSCSARVYWH